MKRWQLKHLCAIRFSMTACLLGGATLACAQSWIVQTLPTRTLAGGQQATVAIAVPPAAPGAVAPIRHVLVYPQSLGTPQLKVASGSTDPKLGGPWVQALPHLQQRGVTLVYADTPSDAERRGVAARLAREVRQDLQVVAERVKQMYPAAQMHLAGFAPVAPLLDVAGDLEQFGKIVLGGSALINNRNGDWSHLRQSVLMLHAPSAQCDGAPFLEAQAVAARSRFKLVQVGYERQDSKADCGRTSQHVFHGQEAAVAQTVADWLDGKEPPAVIGYAHPQPAWREQLVSYQAPGVFGSNRLEATLLLPDVQRHGAGPYPVLVWNHGDIEMSHDYMRYKSRLREMQAVREFLQLGLAVLTPARRGVGLSEGTYPRGFSSGDADATYKARVLAEDIVPALAWLKTRPELDATRIVLAGQSAGGYCSMYLASQNPPGVIGAIDFSGGRTDKRGIGDAGYLNRMMVEGFAEFGKTTRVPTLWVFAENDSLYTANTIRASFEAFQAAGGKARLLLSPPIEGDGHHVHYKPSVWRAAAKQYLTELGLVAQGE